MSQKHEVADFLLTTGAHRQLTCVFGTGRDIWLLVTDPSGAERQSGTTVMNNWHNCQWHCCARAGWTRSEVTLKVLIPELESVVF
jgi:hypothetical protein